MPSITHSLTRHHNESLKFLLTFCPVQKTASNDISTTLLVPTFFERVGIIDQSIIWKLMYLLLLLCHMYISTFIDFYSLVITNNQDPSAVWTLYYFYILNSLSFPSVECEREDKGLHNFTPLTSIKFHFYSASRYFLSPCPACMYLTLNSAIPS